MTAAPAALLDVPRYALYGEPPAVADAEFVHIEDIASRSRLYNWEIRSHTHRGLFQTVFVLEGGARAQLDDRTVDLAAPFAIAIPPAVVHAFQFRPESLGYVLTVAESLLFDGAHPQARALFEGLFGEARVVELEAGPPGTGRVAALLDQLVAEFRWAEPGRALMCECLVRAVLLLVGRRHALVSGRTPSERVRAELFARFRAMVDERIGEQWGVPAYADALGITESRLNRLCRKLAGRSALEVVQDRLLLEARRRLIYIEAPVSMLAYELGFKDPAYFCRFFKKRTGLPPAEFRRRNRPAEARAELA